MLLDPVGPRWMVCPQACFFVIPQPFAIFPPYIRRPGWDIPGHSATFWDIHVSIFTALHRRTGHCYARWSRNLPSASIPPDPERLCTFF